MDTNQEIVIITNEFKHYVRSWRFFRSFLIGFFCVF